jgi:uncharacterized membrane protein
LRDIVYANSRFRTVPTIYPPVAQAVYLLSSLLAPDNLFTLKALFTLADVVTCLALALLLARQQLDPRRVIIYAWCPLPIIEYALQGHLDPLPILLMVLAALAATRSRPEARVLTGVLIGLATLAKLYPILLLVAVLCRRDWGLLIAVLTTLLLGYLPFLILGHGQVIGFLPTYLTEQYPNAGPVPLAMRWVGSHLGLRAGATLLLQFAVDVLLMGTICLVVLRLRWRERISMEASTLVLLGTLFAVSSHVFPWYLPTFLPNVALSEAEAGDPSPGRLLPWWRKVHHVACVCPACCPADHSLV